MFNEKENKWARERGFWETNRGDFLAIGTAAMFFALFVTSLVIVLGPWRLVPPIPGLTAPADLPPPPGPSADQKFHYSVPGEAEVLIFPGKPVILPPPPPEKPQNPPPSR